MRGLDMKVSVYGETPLVCPRPEVELIHKAPSNNDLQKHEVLKVPVSGIAQGRFTL